MMQPGEEALVEMKVNTVQCAGTPAILGALTDITERRKTRLELQRIKDRLESILHSMNDVVVTVSPKDHSILYINPSAEALFGVPVKDFLSGKRHVMDFVHPLDRQKVREFHTSLPETEFASMNDVVVSISPKDHSILAINPSAEALYGIPVRDFSSGKRHVMDFVHPRDVEKVKEYYASLPELEFAELEYRIISNNKARQMGS